MEGGEEERGDYVYKLIIRGTWRFRMKNKNKFDAYRSPGVR